MSKLVDMTNRLEALVEKNATISGYELTEFVKNCNIKLSPALYRDGERVGFKKLWRDDSKIELVGLHMLAYYPNDGTTYALQINIDCVDCTDCIDCISCKKCNKCIACANCVNTVNSNDCNRVVDGVNLSYAFI